MLPTTRLRVNAWILGSAVAGITYVYTQRTLFQSTAKVINTIPGKPQPLPSDSNKSKDPLFGPSFRAACIKKWNKGIDYIFGSLAHELAKRGL